MSDVTDILPGSNMHTIAMAAPTAPSWPAVGTQNLYQMDAQTMQADFERNQDRLFVADNEVNVTIIEEKDGKPHHKRDLETTEQIVDYINVDIALLWAPQANADLQ